MEMTHTRRRKNSNKERKRVLREMKKLVVVVRGHARRYRTLLEEHWQATDWTRRQAEQVLKRIDLVMEACRRLSAEKLREQRKIREQQLRKAA